jgi:hypothetical protein
MAGQVRVKIELKRGAKTATKKMTPKKTNKSKVLHKAKKLEATKPLVVRQQPGIGKPR